jgi:hypothetical protein
LFLTAGRSRVYHTPEDTPDKLDHPKIEATARWLTRFVRAMRTRDEPVVFDADGRDDPGMLGEIAAVVGAIRPRSNEAEMALRYIENLRSRCDATGRLPPSARGEVSALVGMIESRLA